jgi:hypothetical protein
MMANDGREAMSKLHTLCDTCQHVVHSSVLLARNQPLWSRTLEKEQFHHCHPGQDLKESAGRGCHLRTLIRCSLLNAPYSTPASSKYDDDRAGKIILNIWADEPVYGEIFVNRRRFQASAARLLVFPVLGLIMVVVVGSISYLTPQFRVAIIVAALVASILSIVLITHMMKRFLRYSHELRSKHCFVEVSAVDCEKTGKLQVIKTTSGVRGNFGRSLNDDREGKVTTLSWIYQAKQEIRRQYITFGGSQSRQPFESQRLESRSRFDKT